MNIIQALEDPDLLGRLPVFRKLATWDRWLVFLKACYGLPLAAEEFALFQYHIGRTVYDPPPGGWKEIAAVVGMQAGKSRIAATIAVYEAMVAEPEPDGTDVYAILVAQDQRSSLRVLLAYVKAAFRTVPALAKLVEADLGDSLRLTTGVVLAAYPCRVAAVQGLRACAGICDELAYFKSADLNLPQDTEMLRALRPRLATTNGKLITISSPYAQSGALWDLHRQHFGRDGSNVLIWQGTAPEMNGTLSADYLERMKQDDFELYRSAVLGEFRMGLASLFDPEALELCIEPGVRERLTV